jgi:hypothetical protein
MEELKIFRRTFGSEKDEVRHFFRIGMLHHGDLQLSCFTGFLVGIYCYQ